MRMYDIISKKRDGLELTEQEITFAVRGYTNGTIPDYQMAALLMAICINGMTPEETRSLTLCMVQSGDRIDLSDIAGIKVDKHSTGGVGDKTTLIVAPIVAACGGLVGKMSGRGLGYTGGTIDKLMSIPGFQTQLDLADFKAQIKRIGVSIVGQMGNLVPADKKLYALRDVTATVESIPLIAASIMSKKIAAGTDCILLDVKTGSGAFMKTMDSAIELARQMVAIGQGMGRKTMALLTNMNIPLGRAIGNSLEVCEAIQTLNGNGPGDLTEVCLTLAAHMLHLCEKGNLDDCYARARAAIENGSALEKLTQLTQAQGGDIAYIKNPLSFPCAPVKVEVAAPKSGFVSGFDTEKCGIASMLLGAGREKKEDSIDYSAGILLLKKYGEPVAQGEPLAVLHTGDPAKADQARIMLQNAITIGQQKPPAQPLIYAQVSHSGVTMLHK